MATGQKTEGTAQVRHDTEREQEDLLEDDGRAWCGVRTYITGPQTVRAGASATFNSNVHVDADQGCRSYELDEVAWSIDTPNQYKDEIHIRSQSSESCVVVVEAAVPSGTQFTLHAVPKAHAYAKGAHTRVPCQVNKADMQVIGVS
jgi:hypothetical protein